MLNLLNEGAVVLAVLSFLLAELAAARPRPTSTTCSALVRSSSFDRDINRKLRMRVVSVGRVECSQDWTWGR